MKSEFMRMVVTMSFAFCLLVLYQRWVEFNSPAQQAREAQQAAAPTAEAQGSADATLPQVTEDLSSDSGEAVPTVAPQPGAQPPAEAAAAPATDIAAVIANDAIDLSVDASGNIVRVLLNRHNTELGSTPLALLENTSSHLYIGQSGLLGDRLPNHRDPGWSTATVDGRVVSSWESGGVRVERIIELEESGYLGTASFAVSNGSGEEVSGHAYFQFLRDRNPPPNYSKLVPSYFGASIYTDEDKYSKYDFDELEDYPKRVSDGWIGIVQRYFIAAWLDSGDLRENRMSEVGDSEVAVGVIRSIGTIAPGASVTLSQPFFIGALEQDLLEGIDPEIGPDISLAVDYGWLAIVCRPLFFLLEMIDDVIGNWGLSIIVLTVLIKLLFYPLMSKAYRSMARMKAAAPKMQKIKERHGDDKQAMQKEIMELYRKEKVNPLGGCLPIFIQIPVFIALYWMLLESIELRHAPFFLWIQDLSAPDPYYVMPVLLGLSMFGQMRLNPTPPDPTQAMIMKIMPIGFAAFSIFFPSGLTLYWLTNTILSVAQQWHITRTIAKDDNKRSKKGG